MREHQAEYTCNLLANGTSSHIHNKGVGCDNTSPTDLKLVEPYLPEFCKITASSVGWWLMAGADLF
jgi:hypothetical protein